MSNTHIHNEEIWQMAIDLTLVTEDIGHDMDWEVTEYELLGSPNSQ